ncbi:SDR family NAD(P)-dependent oxidoreductase [Dyella jiangningensis]|uniref:NADP-dependent 3-hydroxy acid dehydrogenase YdfG n=1 Tax=Dyella jiangningensis TaxID=1379159 RepID=A0A328P327_9GAMM|nr:SDR family oxidoreductase [Dyella jiangningensis]RAO75693.1 SDR family oxidoreductase [Dyella jiangningensis]
MLPVDTLDTALVTGASTGIGAAYADRLAARGHPLVLVARNREALDTLAARLSREHRVKVDVLPADLTSSAQRAEVERRLREDEAIGTLVNNAGASVAGGLAEARLDDVEAMIGLNVVAPTRLTGALLPRLLARGRGSIINIASALAIAPELSVGAYAATKSYLLTYTLSLHKEVNGRGVQVQAVLPGITRTAIWEHAGKDIDSFPEHMIMEVDEMVDAALAGYDMGELVTVPSLPDGEEWNGYDEARRRLFPELSRSQAADRYKSDIPEDA